MYKNYFKVALRNFWKNKTFSFINIFGLGAGMACFLLISLYVLDELSYDRYNQNATNIYRINADIRFGGTNLHMPVTSDMMGEMLKKDYPLVEEYTRIYASNGSKYLKKGNAYINEANVAHVDSTFFKVFTLPAIAGNVNDALDEPNTVVVTESAAKKYFGTPDVLGKTLETINKEFYKITGVVKDVPQNSHFRFDFFFSMKNVEYTWGQFLSHNFHTYIVLRKGTDPKAFEENFGQYIEKYVMPQAKQYMQINSMEEFRKAGNQLEYSLIPLTKIHLYSDRTFDLTPSGNVQYVYIFSAVAVFILLIACINFMNLTTARSANRAKEVGVRKVLGTEKKNLIYQFLTESVLTAVFAMAIAVALTILFLPFFNHIANKEMTLSNLLAPRILPLLIALPFLVGLLAGIYPAFFLSSFRPIEVLKGKLSGGATNANLRSILVVFQFTTSIILIIGTIIIYQQLHYIQTKNLGFNKNQVLIVNDAYVLKNNTTSFKNEICKLPGVISGTLSSYLPVSSSSRSDNSFSKEAVMDAKSGLDIQNWTVDYDYFKTLGIELKSGRLFSKDYGMDSLATIINEATAGLLGYKDPVGKKIYSSTGDAKTNKTFTIIGVVKNFNFESLHQTIGPLAFFLGESTGLASFKVSPQNLSGTIQNIEAKWKTMGGVIPFSYRFLDDSFDNMYESEKRVGKIAMIFSFLAILIACLGLFGLAIFITEQRIKEIGIRKVLGASVQKIVRLLSREFIILVLIAFFVAAPIAWICMNRWLNDFSYRVEMHWWIFFLAGLVAFFIALMTVSVQATKAALNNPVKNLRSE